jgi:hypothetical protein
MDSVPTRRRRRKAAQSDRGIPSVLDRLTEAEQQRLIDVLADLLLSAVENLERAGIDPAAVARGDVTIRRRGSMLTAVPKRSSTSEAKR